MSRIEAIYHLRSTSDAIAARAEALAIEQSVEMPVSAVRDSRILAEIVGEISNIKLIGENLYRVVIGLAADSIDGDSGQLLNMLFGNSSLHDDVSLQDFELPAETQRSIGDGPRLGLRGLRERVGVRTRALTCAALKPQGLTEGKLAEIAEALARGGVDYIKDDHGLANQRYSPFATRILACAAAVRRAGDSTGHPTRYVPSLTGSLDQIRERIALMRNEGLDTAMLTPSILGLSNAQALARDYPEIAFLSHPSFAGAVSIAPACLAKLLRIIGIDGVIFPNHGGRFGYPAQACKDIAYAARGPLYGLASAVAIPAGGMSVERAPEMIDFYGRDVMLLIGGRCLRKETD
ncbi:RuBisCO large subunit C-terminal-like domain-containing protein [Terrarubrum flagellatum]|uniref:RuBisCO large subunit C-terminal-like domain-containing protein n=1 Tax=Terrirubrum flagellatum TaxID=2895980 RepID=UPI003145535A